MGKKNTPRKNKKSKTGWLWPLAITVFLMITLVAAGYIIFLGPGSLPPSGNPPEKAPLTSSSKNKKRLHIKKIKPGNNKKEVDHQPEGRLAIIIDDMGEQHKIGHALLDLDLPLSFSFLPFASHTRDLLQSARQKKRDILLHLPMEPENPKRDPGKGALYTTMSPTRIKMTIAADLTGVPGAIGVNNHMGSRFTADRKAMIPCLTFIDRKGLFFIDSLTSNASVAPALARSSGFKIAKRDIFLDNRKDVEAIKANILSLVKIARQYGQSIGIGHPYQETLEALRQSQDILQRKVKMVAVHQLVE
ncbi:MAG: divergent polysaccharide deacetylase family protein [Thermodesulfobacteriota bacterium]